MKNYNLFEKFLLVFGLLFVQLPSQANITTYNCSDGQTIFINKPKLLAEVVNSDFMAIFIRMKELNQKVSGESLEDFQRAILNIKTYILQPGDASYGSGTYGFRQEAANYDGCIVIPESLLSQSSTEVSSSNKYLLLHEAMGAAGYQDRNFEITSLLMLPKELFSKFNLSMPMIERKKTEQLAQSRKAPEESERPEQVFIEKTPFTLAGDGGSVIGSGGDSLLLLIKSNIIANLLTQTLLSQEPFYRWLGPESKIMPLDIDTQERKEFFEAISNSTIDYLDETQAYQTTFWVTGVNRVLIANQRVPKIEDLIRSRLNFQDPKKPDYQYHLYFYESEWAIFNVLSSFLQAPESIRFLNEDYTYAVDSLGISLNNPQKDLHKFLEFQANKGLNHNPLLKLYFDMHIKLASSEIDAKIMRTRWIKAVSDHLYSIITTEKASLKALQSWLTSEQLEKLPELLMVSNLYHSFLTHRGAIEMHKKLLKDGRLGPLMQQIHMDLTGF
jgi:hypothetical protein